MKNLTYAIALLLLVACNSHETNDTDSTAEETPCEDRAIGFNTVIPENKWHLGTDEAIQVVKDLDKVWAAKDWDAMKSFMVDTAKFYLPDGRVT